MFDTMTITKTLGALLGSLLIFLLANWAAQSLFGLGEAGGEEVAGGYPIETTETVAATETAPVSDFATVYAAADAEKGAKVFGKCKACHKVSEGVNATGPSLYGVVGRDVASISDFGYSGALSGLGGVWSPERLNEFLTGPKAYAPGTKMTFAGLKKETDRANVIAYLATFGG
jgi:cytochrome c